MGRGRGKPPLLNQPSLFLVSLRQHEETEHQQVPMSFPSRITLIGLFLRRSLIRGLNCVLLSPGLHKWLLSCKTGFYHSQIKLSYFLYAQYSPSLLAKFKFLLHCFRACWYHNIHFLIRISTFRRLMLPEVGMRLVFFILFSDNDIQSILLNQTCFQVDQASSF